MPKKLELDDNDDAIAVPKSGVNEFGGDIFESTLAVDKKARGDFIEPVIDDSSDELAPIETNADAKPDPVEATTDPDGTETEKLADDKADGKDGDKAKTKAGKDDIDSQEDIPTSVPRSRLKKEVAKRNAVQAELDALKAKQPTANTDEVVENKKAELDPKKFKTMQSAMLDGDTEVAMGIFGEMLQTATDSAVAIATEQTRSAVKQDLMKDAEEKAFVTVTDRIYKSFPEFEFGSDLADDTLIGEVIDLRDFYLQKRSMEPADALLRAANEVATEYEIEDRSPKAKAPVPPKPRSLDIARKTELATKEKGALNGSSSPNESSAFQARNLTDKQLFSEDNDLAKRKARGDFLTQQ